MQPLAGIARACGQRRLNKGVDILGVRVNCQLPGEKFPLDLLKMGEDGVTVRGINNALRAEHGRVGHAAVNVLGEQAAVGRDGGVEVVGFFVRLFGKAARPEFHAQHLRFSLRLKRREPRSRRKYTNGAGTVTNGRGVPRQGWLLLLSASRRG
ncbi:hypothetical protein SDC9_196019 [bioreactor metagenome]|uniref:Uncharacterized protein n=1 Tax=bioreactor metagenome TaxID=1076179 RepID=A0A645IC54_9ZZZZ